MEQDCCPCSSFTLSLLMFCCRPLSSQLRDFLQPPRWQCSVFLQQSSVTVLKASFTSHQSGHLILIVCLVLKAHSSRRRSLWDERNLQSAILNQEFCTFSFCSLTFLFQSYVTVGFLQFCAFLELFCVGFLIFTFSYFGCSSVVARLLSSSEKDDLKEERFLFYTVAC